MIYREQWDELINFLKSDRDLIPFSIKIVSYDSLYFKEFCSRATDLEIVYSDIIKHIPPECPAANLADGFAILACETASSTHVLKSKVNLSNDEVFNILKSRIKFYKNPKVVTL